MLATLGVIGFACAAVLMLVALHFHLLGVTTMTAAATEIHYMLGTEAAIYLVTLALSLIVFPMFWNRSFFDGIQWRWAAALRLGWRLPVMAAGCFALAGIDETLLPGPANAPIDEIFRAPGAAWLMFAFGVTLAPFFEELIFRGFLLPALATAWDWVGERFSHEPPRPLDSDGQPQWSLPAMVAASIATSLPFALVHVEQQGHSLGPFLLLIVVSLILCAVRLRTRSLAASTLVHACYNFLIFSLMLIGTGGFRHLD
jgi:membrane protease YdiL (CAAX protease family)